LSYIGNTPAENYASFLTETFTVSATTNYTLSHAVANENDIRLVINGVVQQPGSGKAYTASGTTLTLTSATVSGDVMYAVYLGRALQTVNPPAASVGNSQTAPTIITGQTAETSIATDDTILIHDTSASALRKMTRANFVSGVGGVNTPYFEAYMGSNQTLTDDTATKLNFNTESYDSDGAYDTSTYRFTPQVAGKYLVYHQVNYSAQAVDRFHNLETQIRKNGTAHKKYYFDFYDNYTPYAITTTGSTIMTLNGSSDYIECWGIFGVTTSNGAVLSASYSTFGAYKIIE